MRVQKGKKIKRKWETLFFMLLLCFQHTLLQKKFATKLLNFLEEKWKESKNYFSLRFKNKLNTVTPLFMRITTYTSCFKSSQPEKMKLLKITQANWLHFFLSSLVVTNCLGFFHLNSSFAETARLIFNEMDFVEERKICNLKQLPRDCPKMTSLTYFLLFICVLQ